MPRNGIAHVIRLVVAAVVIPAAVATFTPAVASHCVRNAHHDAQGQCRCNAGYSWTGSSCVRGQNPNPGCTTYEQCLRICPRNLLPGYTAADCPSICRNQTARCSR